MTGAELQQLLDAHCEDMKRNMPGFLFYGILSTTDGNILSKASSNEETAKIIEEGSPYHLMIVNQVNQVLKTNLSSEQLELDYVLIETNVILGISRALLYKCKAEFGTMLDDFF